MNKLKLATVWLDGCSGCHMSLLDLDEGILQIAAQADMVYGPLVDATEFPPGVDIALVEGAVANEHDVTLLREIRARSHTLVAFGDCAVTSNVPSMRNSIPVGALLKQIYVKRADATPQIPASRLPVLLPQARPVHDFVAVDVHLPGCPPSPKSILAVLSDLLAGRKPKIAAPKFG